MQSKLFLFTLNGAYPENCIISEKSIKKYCLALFGVVELLINKPELNGSLPEGFHSGKKTTKVMRNPWLQLESKLPLLSAVCINILESRVHIYLLQCCGGQTSRVARG